MVGQEIIYVVRLMLSSIACSCKGAGSPALWRWPQSCPNCRRATIASLPLESGFTGGCSRASWRSDRLLPGIGIGTAAMFAFLNQFVGVESNAVHEDFQTWSQGSKRTHAGETVPH